MTLNLSLSSKGSSRSSIELVSTILASSTPHFFLHRGYTEVIPHYVLSLCSAVLIQLGDDDKLTGQYSDIIDPDLVIAKRFLDRLKWFCKYACSLALKAELDDILS